MLRFLAAAALVALAVIVNGCEAGDDIAPSSRDGTPTARATRTITATPVPPPSMGYVLAQIDGNSSFAESGSGVGLYKTLLATIARRCADADVEQVANYTVNAVELLKGDYGIAIDNLVMLIGIETATEGMTGLDCQIVTTLLVLAIANSQ